MHTGPNMNELVNLIATALRVPSSGIGPETAMKTTPAWDSLAHMDLILSLETHYRIVLEGDEIAAMTSVAAIAEHLSRRGLLRHAA